MIPYSHAFHTSTLGKAPRDLATDHGVEPIDFRNKVPAVWVRHHDATFRDTRLRVAPTDAGLMYAARDLFAELLAPCRARGMKVYPRILESSGRWIENFDEVRTVDVYGGPGGPPCWSNPDYRRFWAAVATDMFSTYELDGFQWGAERMGPLMNVILPWNDRPPTCFCEHCVRRGEAAGIDAGRAREGFTRLFEYVRGLADDEARPPEGFFTVFLRQAAVSRIADGALRGVDAVGQAVELRLHMAREPDRDRPAVPLDDVPERDFTDSWCGSGTRQRPPARFVDVAASTASVIVSGSSGGLPGTSKPTPV